MKKRSAILPLILFVLGVGIYSLAAFLLTDNRENSFWIAYAFTVAAFLFPLCVQLYLSTDRYASKDGVWTYPAFICGAVYLAVQLLLGIVLLLTKAPLKWSVLLQVAVLAVYFAVLAMILTGMKHMEASDRKQTQQTGRMEELILQAERMVRAESDPDRKKTLQKVYEALRYADPVSHSGELQMMDEQIGQALSFLQHSDDLASDAEALLRLIAERSVLCRRTK